MSSSGCSSTGCSCSGSSAPICCPRSTTTRRCAGWRGRPISGPTAVTTRRGCCARSSSTRTCGCPGCTPSSSISRCWNRSGRPAWRSSHGMTSQAAERQLAALGYEGPQTALNHMSALVNQSGRRGRVQSVLLPRLLDWMSYAPDPDGGLLAYRRLSEALADRKLVPVHAARQARGGQAADARAGDFCVCAGSADARARGHPELRRRAGRPEAARDRARRGGPGAGHLGGPPPRPGAGHRRRARAAPS